MGNKSKLHTVIVVSKRENLASFCIRQFYIRGSNTYRCLFGWTLDKLFVFVLLLLVIHDIQYMVVESIARKCFQTKNWVEVGQNLYRTLVIEENGQNSGRQLSL